MASGKVGKRLVDPVDQSVAFPVELVDGIVERDSLGIGGASHLVLGDPQLSVGLVQTAHGLPNSIAVLRWNLVY